MLAEAGPPAVLVCDERAYGGLRARLVIGLGNANRHRTAFGRAAEIEQPPGGERHEVAARVARDRAPTRRRA